jgi:hypothetical protein
MDRWPRDSHHTAAYVTSAGADWLASASPFPRSVHALWAHRPATPVVLPCGTAFDVVSLPPLFGRRVVSRLWTDGPGTGPVAAQRGRILLFATPGTAQRLPALLGWEEWGPAAPTLLCHGRGDTVTIPPLYPPDPPEPAGDPPHSVPGPADHPERRLPGRPGLPAGHTAAHTAVPGRPASDRPRSDPHVSDHPQPDRREADHPQPGPSPDQRGPDQQPGPEVGPRSARPDPSAGDVRALQPAAPAGRWLVAPDVRRPWLPGAEALLWACVRTVRADASGLGRRAVTSAPAPSGAGPY